MQTVQFNQGLYNQIPISSNNSKIAFGAYERTLMGLKSDAFEKGLSKTIKNEIIENTGLKLVAQSERKRSRAQMGRHYAVHKGKDFLKSLIDYVTRGKFGAYVLEGDDAVLKLRNAAMDIRNKYAFGSKKENLIHSSDSVANAAEEIKNFFPKLDINV